MTPVFAPATRAAASRNPFVHQPGSELTASQRPSSRLLPYLIVRQTPNSSYITYKAEAAKKKKKGGTKMEKKEKQVTLTRDKKRKKAKKGKNLILSTTTTSTSTSSLFFFLLLVNNKQTRESNGHLRQYLQQLLCHITVVYPNLRSSTAES